MYFFYVKASGCCKTRASAWWPTSWTSSATCRTSAACTEGRHSPKWGQHQCVSCCQSPGASCVLCTPLTENPADSWTTWRPAARLLLRRGALFPCRRCSAPLVSKRKILQLPDSGVASSELDVVCVGVTPVDGFPGKVYTDCYPVVLDGAVVGWLESDLAQVVVDSLRRFKVVWLQKPKKITNPRM